MIQMEVAKIAIHSKYRTLAISWVEGQGHPIRCAARGWAVGNGALVAEPFSVVTEEWAGWHVANAPGSTKILTKDGFTEDNPNCLFVELISDLEHREM